MNKRKIINDPVYGFINIPYDLVFDLIEHPYFQRLRRIKQLALADYVYPGAVHTRFHHALGAMHLTTQAIETLKNKGVEITEDEAQGVTVAILLHDIGHGPFSHALEHSLIDLHHEEISLLLMQRLNETFSGALSTAIEIFTNQYPKRFLHQLVSGQLDMDRMDFLNRDSYFTGVHEGVIGYDRIIKMLNVVDNELVVEEKGIFSIEKFLIARRIMYWQVYLHKAVVATEQMLIQCFARARFLYSISPSQFQLSKYLDNLFRVGTNFAPTNNVYEIHHLLDDFVQLDDVDIIAALKNFSTNSDYTLATLSKKLLERKLLKVELSNTPFTNEHIYTLRQRTQQRYNIEDADLKYWVINATEMIRTYDADNDEIKILYKNGRVEPLSQAFDYEIIARPRAKYFLCYP